MKVKGVVGQDQQTGSHEQLCSFRLSLDSLLTQQYRPPLDSCLHSSFSLFFIYLRSEEFLEIYACNSIGVNVLFSYICHCL